MIKAPKVPTLIDPRLIDYALNEIQIHLTMCLPWLDHAFGKAKHVKREVNNRAVTFPAVYQDATEYLKVLPDSHIGNFSFFIANDGEDLTHIGPAPMRLRAQFGLVFWFDFRKVYPDDHEQRSLENVKAEVIEALRGARLKRSTIRLSKVTEIPDTIYREFTSREIEDQYLERPYGGFRIDGEITYDERKLC